ncbi:MAG: CHAT domain-containing protein [Saprospiraceae bacterium]
MDVLYFAFANNPDRPLDELKREDAEINRLLEPLAANGRFRIVRDSFATLDAIADKLRTYRQELGLFHYSGHAGSDRLDLEGGPARALGIAELLGACPNLQLVVLNGCATVGQVQYLHEKGVPAVIATSRAVEDPKAAAFAIQFYRALSYLDPLEAAFHAARSYVLALDDRLDIDSTRGLGLRGKPANTPCWGLSLMPGREDVLRWRLPRSSQAPADYEPNQLLLHTLLNALAPYRADINQIVQDEQQGKKRRLIDKREAVLKALPHPVSELVRYLLTPRSSGNAEMVFFDQPGLARLRQMATLYTTVTELLAFILLAQLWDQLSANNSFVIPETTRQTIRRLLYATVEERSCYDFLSLITAVREALDANACPYFVEELQHFGGAFQAGQPFFEACQFFADVQLRLSTLAESEAYDLSILAEEKLAAVLSELGFVARYTIASVKHIDVLKFRHEKRMRFRHLIVRLEQRFVGLEEEEEDMEAIEDIFDTSSVLLLRENKDGSTSFLTLTPFIIDENAFDEKATVAKLHFLERYVREQDGYTYRHIYMLGEQPLLVRGQENYAILKLQFDAFAHLLFHQPMKDN